MNLVTPLNRVLGLGSAKGGVEHWWLQRVTAVALVPLGIWLVWSLLSLDTFSYGSVVAWASRPLTSVLLILCVLTGVYHSYLGVQVVLEDYLHGKGTKLVALLLSTFAHVLVLTVGVFSILKISFGAS